MASGLSNLSITLPRTKIIEVLTTKRDEILAAFDTKIAEVQAEHDGLPKAAAAFEAWYTEIGTLIADGKVALRADGGFRVLDDTIEVPEKPTKSSISGSKKDLKSQIEMFKSQRKHYEAEFDSTILLLTHATNTDVEVPVGEYERMLSAQPELRRYYY